MNNIYSCRKIENRLFRDIHFIWQSAYNKPDYITINRFSNRVKNEINYIFTQLVLVLAYNSFISMDIEYVNDTKIESKANRNKLIWRKTMETNQAKLMAKISGGPSQIDDAIGQDKVTMDITFFAIASNIKKMC